MIRCGWCGKFIPADTQPTHWETRHNGGWFTHQRPLCPADRQHVLDACGADGITWYRHPMTDAANRA